MSWHTTVDNVRIPLSAVNAQPGVNLEWFHGHLHRMFKYRMIDARGWQGKIEFWKLILMKNNEKHMHKMHKKTRLAFRLLQLSFH
jgi:hypothetical protein